MGQIDFKDKFTQVERILELIAGRIGKDVKTPEQARELFVKKLLEQEINLEILSGFLIDKFFRKILEFKDEIQASQMDIDSYIDYLESFREKP